MLLSFFKLSSGVYKGENMFIEIWLPLLLAPAMIIVILWMLGRGGCTH